MLTEQDRININEYHHTNYIEALKELNSENYDEAKKILEREIYIIEEDKAIENDEESTKIELSTDSESNR